MQFMCASGSPGADSGLRLRRRSCDRSVALGATPLAPETGRGRHPLALTVNGEDRGRADRATSRTCSFVVMPHPPIGGSADAGLRLRWRAMGPESTLSCPEMSLQVLAYNMKRMINIFGVNPLMK